MVPGSNNVVMLGLSITFLYFWFFTVKESCWESHCYAAKLSMFIKTLLHDALIWANLVDGIPFITVYYRI
jgi:hypothetical protein